MGNRQRRTIPIRHVLARIVMTLAAVVMLAPTAWMISTSLKKEATVLTGTPHWLPDPVTFENYTRLFTQAQDFPVFRWLANSIFVSSSVTLLVLLVASTAAYAFSRLEFKGRDTMFMCVVATI